MSLPTPYYEAPGVVIYCARVEDVLPHIDPRTIALLSADVPYGVNEQTNRKAKGRGSRLNPRNPGHDFAACEGDDRPFDPAPLLAFPRCVLWGANHYAERLPSSPSWIVWDKREGSTPDDNADGEAAWTNLGGPLRIYSHLWRGMLKASERTETRVHPMQKPVALYSWLFQWRTKPGDLILAPYAGSGPDVAAARMLGRRIIAIECVETYCAEIVKRIAAPMLPMFDVPPIPGVRKPPAGAKPGQGDLFAAVDE